MAYQIWHIGAAAPLSKLIVRYLKERHSKEGHLARIHVVYRALNDELLIFFHFGKYGTFPADIIDRQFDVLLTYGMHKCLIF